MKPHPVLPRGEGIIKFSPSGRKKEGQISINTSTPSCGQASDGWDEIQSRRDDMIIEL